MSQKGRPAVTVSKGEVRRPRSIPNVSPVQADNDFQNAQGARTLKKHHLAASALGSEKSSG